MAVLRPSLEDLDQSVAPLTDGELRVAHALAGRLDDAWTVYVRPRLGMDVIDFLAVHDTHGVCAIQIAARVDSRWSGTGENPRYISYRHLSTLFEHFYAFPDDTELITPAVRSAVILLDHSTERANRLLDPAHAPAVQRTVEVWGDDVLGHIESLVAGRSCAPPPAASIARLRRHLDDSEVLRELRAPQPMSPGTRNIESNPAGTSIRCVRGPAGSGKSFGLAARAARLASEGKSVLVLSVNPTLTHHLRALVSAHCDTYGADPTRVTCADFRAFCSRVAEDADHQGLNLNVSHRLQPWDVPIAQATRAFEQGFERRYDAVLVDEGQNIARAWWDMLLQHVVAQGGEMLLVSDPTQDVYEQRTWTNEDPAIEEGCGPWTDLEGSYRMPADMVVITAEFARRYIGGERSFPAVPPDRAGPTGASARTGRRWTNVSPSSNLGRLVGWEALALLDSDPELSPSDIVMLCETHEQGLEAVTVVEACGHAVHHLFAIDRREQHRRKDRFWPDAPGIKGSTIQGFTGWESRAVVVGIGTTRRSRRLAYVALTRLRDPGLGRPARITVVNSDPVLAEFGEFFEQPKMCLALPRANPATVTV